MKFKDIVKNYEKLFELKKELNMYDEKLNYMLQVSFEPKILTVDDLDNREIWYIRECGFEIKNYSKNDWEIKSFKEFKKIFSKRKRDREILNAILNSEYVASKDGLGFETDYFIFLNHETKIVVYIG